MTEYLLITTIQSKEICRAIEILRFTGLAAPFMRISNSCSPIVLTLSPSTAGSRNEIMSGVTTTHDTSAPFAEQIALTAVHMSLVDIEPWMVFSVGEMVARENMIFGGRKPSSTLIDLTACCPPRQPLSVCQSGTGGMYFWELQSDFGLLWFLREVGPEGDVGLLLKLSGREALERNVRHVFGVFVGVQHHWRAMSTLRVIFCYCSAGSRTSHFSACHRNYGSCMPSVSCSTR